MSSVAVDRAEGGGKRGAGGVERLAPRADQQWVLRGQLGGDGFREIIPAGIAGSVGGQDGGGAASFDFTSDRPLSRDAPGSPPTGPERGVLGNFVGAVEERVAATR